MAKDSKQSEKRKKIILAVLMLGLVVVVVVNFMGGSKPNTPQQAQNPSRNTMPGQRPQPGPGARRPTTDQEREAWIKGLLADNSELNFRLISHSAKGEDFTKQRNIFAYRPPPPPQPVKQPDPPPITINPPQVQGSIVAGSPFKVPVHVSGTGFPPDATIFFDGRPKPTKGQGSARLTTELEPGEYTYARSINVEVKSQSDPLKVYSNVQSINISDLPPPQIVYHGRHGTSVAAIENPSTKRSELVKRGDTIQGQWRVEAITETGLDLFHIKYEVKRRIPIKSKT